ncbi:MAG: hypothetical protein Kow0074_17230 [Candidatus Zixiibacteriota bacterium]
MTLRDLVEQAFGNLWRIRLRASLTISGVLIAIATFVAMLSFGAGNQKFITDRYNEFGLFTTMHVYPQRDSDNADTVESRTLDKAALMQIAAVPGVRLAYPFDALEVTLTVLDTTLPVRAQALPVEAMETKLLSNIEAGTTFTADSAAEVIATDRLLVELELESPDTLVGQQVVISTEAASLDSALINIVHDGSEAFWHRLRQIRFDSLFRSDYRRRILQQELNEGVRRFIDGYLHRRIARSDTLTITGVIESPGRRSGRASLYLPVGIARQLSAGGFGVGNDPASLLRVMQRGQLFADPSGGNSRTFRQITLDVDPMTPYKQIQDSVEALGFRVFSYAEQFDEIQRFYFYFNLMLGMIGVIALITAALGIVNTMVMSIVERRKEIGILRSLGADERDVRWMFLVESGVIGAVGSAMGIICGWVATRIISFAFQRFLESKDIPAFDPFALPVWLILLALSFGILVSVAAGLYPAGRAARLDPVAALRSE